LACPGEARSDQSLSYLTCQRSSTTVGPRDTDVPARQPEHDLISIDAISLRQILDDAFRPIARDGAGIVEVCLKLFEALETILVVAPDEFRAPVGRFAEELMDRVGAAMSHPANIEVV
jgi:uncharacterized membrane protein